MLVRLRFDENSPDSSVKTTNRIIQSAATLLDAGGIAAVTLRAVGQATGVSHNSPYKHFKNRDSLLAALATQEFESLAAAFTALGQDRVQPLTRLKRALHAFVEYGCAHPGRYKLLFRIYERERGCHTAYTAARYRQARVVVMTMQELARVATEGQMIPSAPIQAARSVQIAAPPNKV